MKWPAHPPLVGGGGVTEMDRAIAELTAKR